MYSGIMYGNCFIPYIKYQIDVDVHVVPSSPVRGPMNVQCIDCVAYTIGHIFVRPECMWPRYHKIETSMVIVCSSLCAYESVPVSASLSQWICSHVWIVRAPFTSEINLRHRQTRRQTRIHRQTRRQTETDWKDIHAHKRVWMNWCTPTNCNLYSAS